MCTDHVKSKAPFHATSRAKPEKNSTKPSKTRTSQQLRYERRQIKTLCVAHYQWVYGKITRPSDKLAVIDLELETYAPAADGSGFHRFLSFFFELWNGV